MGPGTWPASTAGGVHASTAPRRRARRGGGQRVKKATKLAILDANKAEAG